MNKTVEEVKTDNEFYREGYRDGYHDGVLAAREDARQFFEAMNMGDLGMPPSAPPK